MKSRRWSLTGKPPRVEHVVLNLTIPLRFIVRKFGSMPDRNNDVLSERTKYGFRKIFSANLEVSYSNEEFAIMKGNSLSTIKGGTREAWLSREVKRFCRTVIDDIFEGNKELAKNDPLFMKMLKDAVRDFNSLGV